MNKRSKTLSTLLQGIVPFDINLDIPITGLTENSRTVKPGDLFFARRGAKSDGCNYIADAIKAGAVAIIVETEPKDLPKINHNNVPIFVIKDLAQVIGSIAERFYDYPSKDMQIIGITGTNGKTTCSHFLAQALHLGGELCGIIGTLGNGFHQQLHQSSYTTPDAIAVQKLLAEFRDEGAKYVAMEVTSHALSQGRVNGVKFDIAVFTNLTRDHLDYHGNIASYAAAKRSLFSQPELKYGVFNADDDYGRQWVHEFANTLQSYSYSLSNHSEVNSQNENKIFVHHAQLDSNGITASIHTPWGDGVLHNPRLAGRFNLSNLLAVVTVLGILGLPLETILLRMSELRGVAGRMESFGGNGKPLVVVDFAHTPDALEQVLQALKEYKQQGILWCVFGCGGDRDRGKRPLMGKIAEQYADQLVITDDNPRHEDPREIVSEIFQGLTQPEKAVIEHDRRRAIAHAISCAQPNDIVLIAGKGHETVQIVGDEKEPFNDALEVQKFLFPS